MKRLAEARILLVEDNPGDVSLIKDMLDSDEVSIKPAHAETLAGAERLLEEIEFDAILLDLGLPDGTGLDCLRAIRRHSGAAAILVLTGHGSESLALECLAAGAQDYIDKNAVRPYGLRRAIGYAITRMREAEAQAKASGLRARLAAIVESSGDAIISCAPDGLVTSWNPGAAAIFGYSYDEAIGQPVHAVIRAREGEEPQQIELMTLALAGTFGGPREIVRLRRDGRAVALSAVAFPLPENGTGPGFGAICRDITEKRERDKALRRQNRMLVARGEQMRALTARLNAVREDERIRISREVHDELGQLLTALKMDLHWIGKRVVLETPVRGKLGEAERLVDRTVATVQRIATELRPSALDSLGLPAAIRDEARRFAARTGIEVNAEVSDAALPPAEPATAMFRIFQEILTNVARHAGATRLRVRLALEPGNWLLAVHDNGVGLAAEALDRPTSLGLLGMTERAEQLGGSIRFKSQKGRGTEVIVRIPVMDGEQGNG